MIKPSDLALRAFIEGVRMSKQKTLGTALESRVVKLAREAGLKASKQPGSGVYTGFPADATIEDILVECKVRTASVTASGKKSFSVDLKWLEQVTEQADPAYRMGVVVIQAKYSSERYVVLNFTDFLALVDNH